jgi:hypothetical protein
MKYIVLGMHKSGTTLVSKLLHNSGIDMGDFSEDLDYGKCKYEREEFKALNKRLLRLPNKSPLHIRNPLRAEDLSEEELREMQCVVSQVDAQGTDWGTKDPRMCLVYQAWKPQIGEHRVIGVYRHPTEFWYHLRRQYTRKGKYWWQKMLACYRSILTWDSHNREVLKAVRQTEDGAILLHFARLVGEDREVARLEEFAGRPITDVREQRLYRNRSIEPDLYYRIASTWCRIFHSIDNRELLEELEAERAKAVGATE